MRTKMIAAAAVMGLFGLILAAEAAPSGAGGGQLANCLIDNEPNECATLEVTKVVTGTAPPGTTFPVVVDCQLLGDRAQSSGALPPGNVSPFMQTHVSMTADGIPGQVSTEKYK